MKFFLLGYLITLGCTPVQKQNSFSDDTKVVSSMHQDSLRFLALGDSYTIGESVPEDGRWPVQLTSRLQNEGISIIKPKIIATTGWTTDELQEGISAANIQGQKYDLVSLLIGVNNQFRGYDFSQYEREFKELLSQAVDFAGGDVAHVFVVSIPDYGVTPFGKTKDPIKIAKELKAYNAYAQQLSGERGIKFINITDQSRKADMDTSLVASDGLHPSAKMYSEWVSLIYPWTITILDE